MIDLVKLTLLAGNGGNGRVSMLREKYRPKGGPDGGNGGNGASIVLRGNKNLNTLGHYAGAKIIESDRGQDGLKKNKSGQDAEDIILDVPVGTTVWELASTEDQSLKNKNQKYYLEREGQRIPKREAEQWFDAGSNKIDKGSKEFASLSFHSVKNVNFKQISKRKLLEINEDGQKVVVCQGGQGGQGNTAFKGPGKQVPLEAEYGQKGEKRIILLELKLLADLGLVGFPSAGKSTFLSVVTQARPKIAEYHFTTLEAGLGVMRFDHKSGTASVREMVVADIPGLIEGASRGKGLGFEFLRHVERCKLLLYILSLDESEIFNKNLSDKDRVKILKNQFKKLKEELVSYEKELGNKDYLITINKIDLYSPELIKTIKQGFKSDSPFLISCATGEGIDELKKKIQDNSR
ncbi:MAG: GTPase [Patescibacteria group bacterium]